MQVKESLYYALLSVLISFFSSCSKEDMTIQPEPVLPQIVDGVYNRFIISTDGSGVRLCCGLPGDSLSQLKYRWYELLEGKENELQGAIDNYYDIEFADKGLKQYKCKLSGVNHINDSTVREEYPFTVAYTGLPLVKVTTENERNPLLNKTEKIPGIIEIVERGGKFCVTVWL